MSKIINESDIRYSKLNQIFSKYNYDNMIKYFDNKCCYHIPVELVLSEYYTDYVWITYHRTDWNKSNWVSRYYLKKILLETTGLTVQELFDLTVLHINDTDLRPKCSNPECNEYVPFHSFYYGYGVGSHSWDTKLACYCSSECRESSNYQGLISYVNSEESRKRSSEFFTQRNSNPKFQAENQYFRLINNNINLYFYLALVRYPDTSVILKFGCCNDLDTRFGFAKNFNGYATIHQIMYADAVTAAMLEWRLKELYDYSEYLDISELSNIIKYIKSYKLELAKLRKIKKIKKIRKLNQMEKVYDLTTKNGYHNFCLANGVVVHNCGKSLFLQSEATNFIKIGKRVHMLVMGDLNEIDLVTRMLCQITSTSQREIESDIVGYFNLNKDKFKDYLSITVVPSSTVTAEEYVDWMIQRADDYDVLMIDYDSNFLQDESYSMYERGGTIYDQLTKLSRLGKLVMVASQPKQSYWSEEFLPYDAVAESSRKVHIADMILTIGRRWSSKQPMGYFNIAKLRRGIEDCVRKQPYIRSNSGLFYCCSDILYQKFAYQNTTARYSYSELQSLDALSESLDSINSEVNPIDKIKQSEMLENSNQNTVPDNFNAR